MIILDFTFLKQATSGTEHDTAGRSTAVLLCSAVVEHKTDHHFFSALLFVLLQLLVLAEISLNVIIMLSDVVRSIFSDCLQFRFCSRSRFVASSICADPVSETVWFVHEQTPKHD
jgi:hypothetical protein